MTRDNGSMTTIESRPVTVEEVLAELVAAATRYDPENPRAKADVITSARDLIKVVGDREKEATDASIAEAWAHLKDLVSPDIATLDVMRDVIKTSQELHRIIHEKERTSRPRERRPA